MLRRYNSKNLDTILLKNRRTTIGSAETCDVVLKGKGIAPIHASIESNSSGFWLREHSLSGITRVNDRPVFGQVEIHSGDLIQVGGAPPFVFDSEWMFGTRPNSAKPVTGKVRSVSGSPAPEDAQSSILPVIGKKIIHSQSAQPSRPKRSASQDQSMRSSASSTESHRYYNNVRSVGNNLLQRVVKLQAEVIEKDEKIRQLTSHHQLATIPPHIFYQPPPLPPPPQSIAPRFSTTRVHHSDQKSFELFAYRAFIGAIASQLRQFNDRVLRTPQRDSAELFSAMCRAVDVPLTSRIVEIEKYCEAVMIDNDFEDGDELMHRLDNFIRESRREKILELTNELEVIMPLIRDAAANARENIKVCNVFTQWSRQFGDLLRKSSFSSSVLFQAIDDLKTQFSEAHMSRHWLPPSITPILRLAALELEKRDGDVTPSVSPVMPLDRKKSIDMTLDTCISQVETITHEMDYHIVRLHNKARDYSSFQTLDLESVTRISKILESLKSSIELLSEHSFKEPPRPNSVLFFEITNDDITNTIKNSDGEGSTSSLRSLGSNGSAKKVSVAPKISDPLSEDDEILEERKTVEETIMGVVRKIQESLHLEKVEPKRMEGMIMVDASVLKMLIDQSQHLLGSFVQRKNSEVEQPMCSKPPQIVVEEQEDVNSPIPEDVEEEEAVVLPVHPISAEQIAAMAPSDESAATSESESQSPVPIIDSPDLEDVPEDEEHEEAEEEDVQVEGAEDVVEKEEDGEGMEEEPALQTPESEEEVEGDDFPKRSSVVVMNVPNDLRILKKSYSEDTKSEKKVVKRSATVENHEVAPISPPPSPEEIIEEQDDQNEHEEEHEEHDNQIDDESEEERESEPIPFADDDKSTVRYVPNAESQELSPQNSVAVGDEVPPLQMPPNSAPTKMNGDVVMREGSRRHSEKMSSHLRSHINTANGKPHITYQYPIKYYSPPMKRRSKSEDQKIRETLATRPPFVLY